jgi:sucrose-6-phosphatase
MKFLAISDLDNTWIGNHQATIDLQKALRKVREDFYLIYATGRSFASVAELMRDFWLETGEKLLEPDFIIAGVGTEIYHKGVFDYDWATYISQGWQRNAVDHIARSFPTLIPQAEAEQNPWKISFCLYPLAPISIIQELEEKIEQQGLAAKVIFSSGVDVDLLPVKADKGLAASYLRQKVGISPERTLVCGDSGNDISLFQQGTLGAIVSNARSELLEFYLNQPNPQIYLAKSAYGWGILETLKHFHLL